MLPGRHHRDGGRGEVDGELEAHDPVVVGTGHLVARVPEDLDHLDVLGKHHCGEPLDAVLPTRLRQVLQQHLAAPAPLMPVLDEERHLGLGMLELLRNPLVAAHRDDLLGHGQDECDPRAIVHVGEPLDVLVRQRRHRGEEAEVLRLVADPGVEGAQQVSVLGTDRPDMGRLPVPEEDVGLPVSGEERFRRCHGRNLARWAPRRRAPPGAAAPSMENLHHGTSSPQYPGSR